MINRNMYYLNKWLSKMQDIENKNLITFAQ